MLEKWLEGKSVEKLESMVLRVYQPINTSYIVVYKDRYRILTQQQFAYNSKFLAMDFFSNLVTVNKAVDSSKKILSNNCYSFFIRKTELLTEELIDIYYEKTGLKIKDYWIKQWMIEHIDFIKNFERKSKILPLKIFFITDDFNEFLERAKEYLFKASLSNQKDGYGVPLLHRSYNQKKPYENGLRRFKTVDVEMGYKYYLFVSLLKSFYRQGCDITYFDFDNDNLIPVNSKKHAGAIGDFMIWYSINIRGELEIHKYQPVIKLK